jgi:hypothetical protein
MADKKSLAEAITSIRRQKKIVKKSLAGIGREFDVSPKPETKALTSYEGTAIMNPAPLQPLRRKLKLAPRKTEPVMEEKKEEPVPDKSLTEKTLFDFFKKYVKEPEPEEEAFEEKQKAYKNLEGVVRKIEEKPAKYRIKRNTMNISL